VQNQYKLLRDLTGKHTDYIVFVMGSMIWY